MPPSDRQPPAADLLNALVAYCHLVDGEPPTRLSYTLLSGARRTMTIPIGLAFKDVGPGPGKSLEVWPPPAGWGFRQGEAAYDGTVFPVAGKAAAVLQLLAGRPDGVTAAELKRIVWQDLSTDERTVQNAVSAARSAVRKGLGIEVETIHVEEGRYRLASF